MAVILGLMLPVYSFLGLKNPLGRALRKWADEALDSRPFCTMIVITLVGFGVGVWWAVLKRYEVAFSCRPSSTLLTLDGNPQGCGSRTWVADATEVIAEADGYSRINRHVRDFPDGEKSTRHLNIELAPEPLWTCRLGPKTIDRTVFEGCGGSMTATRSVTWVVELTAQQRSRTDGAVVSLHTVGGAELSSTLRSAQDDCYPRTQLPGRQDVLVLDERCLKGARSVKLRITVCSGGTAAAPVSLESSVVLTVRPPGDGDAVKVACQS